MKTARNAVYIRVLLVVLAVVMLLAFANHAPQRVHHDTWLPSSFNPIGEGNMAFYDTLQELNWPVERWRDPLGRLANEGTGNVLIITRSANGAADLFTSQEIDILDNWVKRGNTLVLLGALGQWSDTREMLTNLNFVVPENTPNVVDLLHSLGPQSNGTIQLHPATTDEIGTMVLPKETHPLPITFPHGAKVLWQSDDGQPYMIEVPRGSGQVICGASDEILANKFLPQGDNLAIITRLLAPYGATPTHLFFEESRHGYSGGFALVRLLDQTGVRFAGMLALLGALAFLGSSLVRFGPIIPLHRETGRSTLEFVDSIADLYLRADQRNDTIKYLFTETHQRLLQRLNLPSTASNELIASRLALAYPHLPKWKKLAQRFDSSDYTEGLPPSGWLRVAKDLIEIRNAIA